MRAVLYARVSSQEQANKGYSLQDQLRTLRAYAEEHGHEVVEVVEDAGYSGASLERPGLNRARDLVATGGISVVLAQDRDRIARDPVISGWLKIQFEQHGCKLRALNDPHDESPTGDLTAGILDQIAKFERAMTAQRTRRGRFQRAREGNVIGSGSPPYGYKYNTDRSNYEVDEETMPVVRRMFEMVAAGSTLHSVKATFESEGIATPGGGQRWYTVSMRRMVLNDVYKGTWWYGVNRVKLTPMGDKRRTWERNPESEHVAVPVPDAGIPHEVIVAARSRIRNGYSPRQDAKHYYELRGLLYCIECGAKMTGYSTGDGSRYYTCQKRRKWGKSACDGANRTARTPTKRRRSVGIENEVMDYVQDIISDPAKLTAQLDAAIAQEARKNPAQDVATWLNMIEDCDRKRATYQDQQAAWLMTLEELGDKLQHLSGTKEVAEQHVAQARGGERRVEELRATKRAMLEAYEQGIYYDGIGAFSPEMRREIYEALRLKVTVGHDLLKFEADVDADVIRLTREVEAYAEEVEQYRGKLKVTSLRGTDKVMAEVAG